MRVKLGKAVCVGSGPIKRGWAGCWRPGQWIAALSAAIALFLSTIMGFILKRLSSFIPIKTTAQFKLMTPASPPQSAYSLQNAFK